MMAKGVPRIPAAGFNADSFFSECVVRNRPVVIMGMLDGLPALNWTLDGLAAKSGASAADIPVAPLSPSGRDKRIERLSDWPIAPEAAQALEGVRHPDRLLAVSAPPVQMPFLKVLDALRQPQDTTFYSDGASNSNCKEGGSFGFLAEDVSPAEALVADRFGKHLIPKSTHLWLGGRTVSSLHFDNVENLFCQLVGSKDFLLVPPDDSDKLVDGRLRKAFKTWTGDGFIREAEGLSDSTVMNYAAYDIHDPPKEYAEAAAAIRRVHVSVGPGEVLFLPFGWWHEVTAHPSEGLSVSLTFTYEPLFVRLQPKSCVELGTLSINPKYQTLLDSMGLLHEAEQLGKDHEHSKEEAPVPALSEELKLRHCVAWSDMARVFDRDAETCQRVLTALEHGFLSISGLSAAVVGARCGRCVFDCADQFEAYRSLGNGITIGYREDGNASFLECRLLQTTVAGRTMAKLQPTMPDELAKPLQEVFATRLLVAHAVLTAVAVALGAQPEVLTGLIDPAPQAAYKAAGLAVPKAPVDAAADAAASRSSREMRQRMSSSALRLCRYAPECAFGAHTDTSMMGIATGGCGNQNPSGMEMELADGWVSSLSLSNEDVMVWPGDFLACLTKHRVKSMVHRIPATMHTRFSAPVIVRIDPEAVLDKEGMDGTDLMSPGQGLRGKDLRQFVEAKRKLVAKNQDPDDDYSLNPFEENTQGAEKSSAETCADPVVSAASSERKGFGGYVNCIDSPS
eukprot:TRINITY_DN51225_c0_g1_i1.p1 TRINITY_DN51225_c0_g1~~TRINITY_DN51225_c0_g1_i1.p1  ORF type:complete len:757 (-),score=129.04 TRINITY_DN51225_c0_g1_i1:10-2220(-)